MIISMLWKSRRTENIVSIYVDVPYVTRLQELEEKARIIAIFMERDAGFNDYSYVSSMNINFTATAMPSGEVKRYLTKFGTSSQQYLKEFL